MTNDNTNQNQTKPAKLTSRKVARGEYVAEIDGRFFWTSFNPEAARGCQWDLYAMTKCEKLGGGESQVWADVMGGYGEGFKSKNQVLEYLAGNPAAYCADWDEAVTKAFYQMFPSTYRGEQPTAKHAGWQWAAIQAKCEKAERKITAPYVAKLAEYQQTSHGYTVMFAGRTLTGIPTKAEATHRAEGFRLGAMEQDQMDDQISNPDPEWTPGYKSVR